MRLRARRSTQRPDQGSRSLRPPTPGQRQGARPLPPGEVTGPWPRPRSSVVEPEKTSQRSEPSERLAAPMVCTNAVGPCQTKEEKYKCRLSTELCTRTPPRKLEKTKSCIWFSSESGPPKRLRTTELFSNDRAFKEKAKKADRKNAHRVFEASGLHVKRPIITISGQDAAEIYRKMPAGHKAVKDSDMPKIAQEVYDMMQQEQSRVTMEKFYDSDVFKRYHKKATA